MKGIIATDLAGGKINGKINRRRLAARLFR